MNVDTEGSGTGRRRTRSSDGQPQPSNALRTLLSVNGEVVLAPPRQTAMKVSHRRSQYDEEVEWAGGDAGQQQEEEEEKQPKKRRRQRK